MIPRVARGSTSFSEANNYYMHDKEGEVLDRNEVASQSPMEKAGNYALFDKNAARTSYRVGFTETLNLDATDPHEAIRQMQARYDAFKAQEHHKRGRKLQKPVYSYSLSWSPDENPSRDEMLAAARSSLKAMRLEGLQTLIVQHLDEPQPHIHLIVHRIEADGKRARNIPWDHLRFSRWAEAYEREHGKVLCTQREQNNAERARGAFVRDQASLSRRDYEASQPKDRDRTPVVAPGLSPDQTRNLTTDLFRRHAAERASLEKACTRECSAGERMAREALGKTWTEVAARQTRTLRELKLANNGGLLERSIFVFRHRALFEQVRPLSRREIAGLCVSPERLSKAVAHAHRHERTEMLRFEQSCVAKSVSMVHDRYRVESREMVARQCLERDLLVARLTNESHQTEPSVPLAPSPVPAREEPAQAPELRQGEQLTPVAAHSLLTDPAPLRDVFNNQVTIPPPASRRPGRRGRADDFDRGL